MGKIKWKSVYQGRPLKDFFTGSQFPSQSQASSHSVNACSRHLRPLLLPSANVCLAWSPKLTGFAWGQPSPVLFTSHPSARGLQGVAFSLSLSIFPNFFAGGVGARRVLSIYCQLIVALNSQGQSISNSSARKNELFPELKALSTSSLSRKYFYHYTKSSHFSVAHTAQLLIPWKRPLPQVFSGGIFSPFPPRQYEHMHLGCNCMAPTDSLGQGWLF